MTLSSASWTLEQSIRDRGFKPGNLADQFVGRGTITGIGKTVAESLHRYRSGKRWYESGLESAGNGALMRISPMLIPLSPERWDRCLRGYGIIGNHHPQRPGFDIGLSGADRDVA
jgi:hypothetical protein